MFTENREDWKIFPEKNQGGEEKMQMRYFQEFIYNYLNSIFTTENRKIIIGKKLLNDGATNVNRS